MVVTSSEKEKQSPMVLYILTAPAWNFDLATPTAGLDGNIVPH